MIIGNESLKGLFPEFDKDVKENGIDLMNEQQATIDKLEQRDYYKQEIKQLKNGDPTNED